MKKYIHNLSVLTWPVLLFTLISCGNVMENKYSKKTAEGDLERIMAISHLDSTEYAILTDYMVRKDLIEPDLLHLDQSYEEILQEAKKEREMLNRKRESDRKRKENKTQFSVDHMDHLHKELVMLPEQSSIRKDWSNKNAFFYKMVFVNETDKTIRAFKGKFTFFDLFDTELKTVDMTYNDTIAAHATIEYNANIDFSNVNNNVIYVTKDFSDLKAEWRPTKILYSDGSVTQ